MTRIGCGLNALNDHPTTSLASLAPSLRETLRIEDLAASVLARFEALLVDLVASSVALEASSDGLEAPQRADICLLRIAMLR